MKADVKVTHPKVGELSLKTGDISDGGAYILASDKSELEIGQVVTVQVQGLGSGEAPAVKMQIVRTDKDGIGLAFVTDDEDQ